jgi:hypothetical protein
VGNIIMTKFVRLAALAAVTFAATPAFAQVAASPKANATVRITKPLILEAEENLDFGTIAVYGPGTVSVSQGGAGTCGPAAEMVCDFTLAKAARFRVKGSNNPAVTIAATGSTLARVGGGASLGCTPDSPTTLTLPNSGSVGTTFNVGGSFPLAAGTPAGTYVG